MEIPGWIRFCRMDPGIDPILPGGSRDRLGHAGRIPARDPPPQAYGTLFIFQTSTDPIAATTAVAPNSAG
jgi:hypothetical protein